jgi:hypothetical protein
MVVARSEIRAVRRVVKQFPVEMLQQCSSASNCMRERALSWRSTTPDVSIPRLLFWIALSNILVYAIHLWRYCGSLLHKFHHQHSFPGQKNSYQQLSGR